MSPLVRHRFTLARAAMAIACAAAVACGLFPSLAELANDAGPIDATSIDVATEAGCGTGLIACDGSCVDPSSPLNCNGCGNVCNDGLCGKTVTASLDGGVPSTWNLNGEAVYEPDAGATLLAPPHINAVGSMIYANPIAVDAFTVTFDYRSTVINGNRLDGLGFMIEQTGPHALGSNQGGGLGIAGLHGYGVELDLYNNDDFPCGDNSADHIGVDDLTICSSQGIPTSLFATKDLSNSVDLADGHWHTVVVTYANNTLSVALDGMSYVTDVGAPVDAGAPYYFGFGGAIGGGAPPDGGPGGAADEIRNIDITFPTPRCL